MRVLVLSCSTGGGHNSAANAVIDYFTRQGDECVLYDALRYISKGASSIISNGHVFIYKNIPGFFGFIYRFAEKHPGKKNRKSFMYKFMQLGARSFRKHIEKEKFDLVICSHVFAGMMVNAAKRKYPDELKGLKLYLIGTDYTCLPGTLDTDADCVFIPHAELTEEHINAGVPKNKIVPSGIPVREKFYEKITQSEAKRALGLPDKRIVLLTCGSMGCGPIGKLTDMLEQKLPQDAHLVVVCGNNKKLYKSLTKKRSYKNVTVVGFTAEIHLYMSAAEFCLTKPGGLSSTEAFVKGLPLILIDTVPGCETKNLKFFLDRGIATTAETSDALIIKVLEYLNNSELLNSVKNTVTKEFGNAPEIIYTTITKGSTNENI